MNKVIKIVKDIIKYPPYLFVCLAKMKIIKLQDERYLKIRYRALTGEKLNLENPKTYNEKLQWLKLYNRKDIYTTMVDKYDAKEFIKQVVGEEYVIPTYGVYESFDEIDFLKLPEKYIMKCTHDSGGLVICNGYINKKKAMKKINKSLKKNYYISGREWPYKNVKPRIIIERLLENTDKQELIEYDFFCFNGEPKIVTVCHGDRNPDRFNDFYDINFNKLNLKCNYESSNKVFEKPKLYEEMINVAKKLCKEVPFLRVDLYLCDNKIYVGELTFFHWGGCGIFKPEEWNKKMGDMLKLDIQKKN